jgi:hypothetical protein
LIMASSKRDSYSEPSTPQPSGGTVPYGQTSPIVPAADAYTSYLTQGQTASGGMPVNTTTSSISGALPTAAASSGSAAQANSGQVSGIDRINKLLKMGIGPKDLLSVLLAASDPETDNDIFFSNWSGGGGGSGRSSYGGGSDAMSAPQGSFGPGGNSGGGDPWGGLR